MPIKTVFLLLLFLNGLCYANAQTCTSVHQGKFKISEKGNGVTIITRYEQYQSEVNADYNLLFSVTWIDECKYELRLIKVIKGDAALLSKNITVTVEIVDIKKHGYKAICTSNLSEEKMIYILEKIE